MTRTRTPALGPPARRRPGPTAGSPFAAEPEAGRKKISITVDQTALDVVRSATANVSAFYDAAAKEKLYFLKLDQEAARLDAEGARLDRGVYDWVVAKIAAARAHRGPG